MDFYKSINQIMQMKELKSVAWKVHGEDQFNPDKYMVRFEDVEGTVFELLIHPDNGFSLYDSMRSVEAVILNVAFTHFGIVPSGSWIGWDVDIEKMVNLCRQKAPYTGVFFVNRKECARNSFLNPIHIF